jgi:hypothetical protein
MSADKSEGRIRDRRPYWPRRMKLHLAASYIALGNGRSSTLCFGLARIVADGSNNHQEKSKCEPQPYRPPWLRSERFKWRDEAHRAPKKMLSND